MAETNPAEFDAVADDYARQHSESIRMSGESPEYFANYKAEMASAAYAADQVRPPSSILDFGAGIGNSVPPLRANFPDARITCLDVSQRSLELCAERFGNDISTQWFDGQKIPVEDTSYDMVFVACVFHHIPHANHLEVLRELRRVLQSGGRLFLFEHNPWNPLTRIAVANCPFDENAELISPIEMRRRVMSAGVSRSSSAYGPFFPAILSKLRPAEDYIRWLPMGAQYVIEGRVG